MKGEANKDVIAEDGKRRERKINIKKVGRRRKSEHENRKSRE